MRILFWSELFWPYIGGAEIFGARLIRALKTKGHEFAIATSHDTLELPDQDTFEDTPVVRLPFRAAVAGRELRKFHAAQQGVVYGSKAVGEPPFMLAISVREAIRDAVAAFGPPGMPVPLPVPATCEAIFMAIRKLRSSPRETLASHRPVPLAYR